MVPPPFLPYGRQCVEDDDIAAVAAVLRSDYLTTGPAVPRFEAALAARTGAPHALACANGTAALHLACTALGLGAGDAAIVPAITFVATANAPRLAGAEIVFADVDPDSGLMGAEELEDAVAEARRRGLRPRMVLPVHLTGATAPMEAIVPAARRHGLKIVEDCCHALGAQTTAPDGTLHPAGACAHADAAAFSFHPVKAIAAGEGGAVTCADPTLARRLALMRNHGLTREAADFTVRDMAFDADGVPNAWWYEEHEPAFNQRLSDIAAALAASQIGKLDRFLAARRALAGRYDAALAPLAPRLRPVARPRGRDHGWHLYAVLVDFAALRLDRNAVTAALRARGIGTQVHYIPVHRQPYYARRYGVAALPGADAYYARTLSLPFFVGMTPEDVERVAGALAEVLGPA